MSNRCHSAEGSTGWISDGDYVRIDLAPDASGLTFEATREAEAVET